MSAPPSLFADLPVFSWLCTWAEGRGPDERGENEERERQVGERVTRGCHGYRRIPASPRCHGDASHLSFTFICPLFVSFVLPALASLSLRAPRRFPSLLRPPPSGPLTRLTSASQLAKLLSTSGIRSYSLRSFERRGRGQRESGTPR